MAVRETNFRLVLGGAIGLCLALVFVAAALNTEKAPGEGDEEGEKKWGLYQIYWGGNQWGEVVGREIERLRSRPNLLMIFRDLSLHRGFPEDAYRISRDLDATLVVSLELEVWGSGRKAEGGIILERIIAGEFDAFFRQYSADANASVLAGDRTILRFGFEMNGDWFAWGEQPELFIAAWQRAHRIVEEHPGGAHIDWMWSPNVIWGDRTPEDDLFPYYPGDRHVDLLGLDGYNFGDDYDRWHRWQSYTEVFEESIAALSARYDRPLYLAEIGCADDPRKDAWLSNFFQTFTADARLAGFIWFHYDKRGEGEPNWRLDSDAKSLEIARAWLPCL